MTDEPPTQSRTQEQAGADSEIEAHEAHDTPADSDFAGEGDTRPFRDGLALDADGLGLSSADVRLDPGVDETWAFYVRDAAGNVVTDFEERHGKSCHLLVVRRDLRHFQRLHPTMADDGTWTIQLTLPEPGVYRAFVDVTVDGDPTTLGIDLFASGPADYAAPGEPTTTVAADGYDVSLATDQILTGEDATLTFSVDRDGGDITRLEPYLDAFGHLVVLRAGDLAYRHLLPAETEPERGALQFETRFPSEGRYRCFLQTRPDGDVLTTAFDVDVESI